MKNKIINFRGFFLIGFLLIIHILLCFYIFNAFKYDDKINALVYLAIGAIITIALTVIIFLIFIWKKRGFNDRVLTLIIYLVSMILTVCFIANTFNTWPENKEVEDVIYGRVVAVNYNSNYNSYNIVLDKVYLREEKIHNKVVLYAQCNDSDSVNDSYGGFDIGNNVEVDVHLYPYKLDGQAYNSNIAYRAYINRDDIRLLNKGEKHFIEEVQCRLHDVLIRNLGSEHGELSYSMITGDKNGLDSDIRNSFSLLGLGHLLAVSGLHIGFITAAFSWVLKKLRVNKYLNFSIITIFIIFYCALANFSGSVMRASIMTILALIASLAGERNDSLNTLFISVSLILTFRPLLIMYVGFILSITAVFGIIIFSRGMNMVLKKVKCPKFLSELISIGVSATLGILPVTIIYFHNFSVYSIFCNLVAVPIISISFVLILFSALLTIVLPFMSFALKISSIGLYLVNEFTKLVSQLPGSSLMIFGGVGLFLIYLLYFIGSRFIIKRKRQLTVIIMCFILTLTLMILPNIGKKRAESMIFFGDALSVQNIIYTDDQVFFVGELGDFYSLKETMITMKLRKLDGLYLTSLSERSVYNLKRYFDYYPMAKVYFPIDEDTQGLKILIQEGIEFETFEEDFDFGNKISAYYSNGLAFYKYTAKDFTIGFLPRYGFDLSSDIVKNIDIIRCYEEPDITDASTKINLADKIFLVNKRSEGNFKYCLDALENIYEINFETENVKELKRAFL